MRTTAWTRRRSTRAIGLLVLAGAMSGCETHRITRPPDPPIDASGRAVIVTAVVAVGLGWLAVTLRWLVGQRRLSPARWGLAGGYTAGTLLLLGWVGFDLASALRREVILGAAGCRDLPLADRPRQIVQLTCETDTIVGIGPLLLLLVLPPVAFVPLCAWLSARSTARPWLPTILSAGLLAAMAAVAVSEGWPEDTGNLLPWTLVTALSATLTGCGVLELTAPVPRARVPAATSRRHRGRLQADRRALASFADRLQALIIDLLLLLPPLTFAGDRLEGPAVALVAVALTVGYLGGSVAVAGGTVGHRLVGLTVVDGTTRQRPSPAAAGLRVAVLVGGPLLLILAEADWRAAGIWFAVLLLPLCVEEGRPLHDLVAGTHVLRAR